MKKILIVEDDRALAAEIQDLLKKATFATNVANNLAEATEKLNWFPDLIVLDWNLPDGDGLTWLVRQRQKQLSVPTLMLSARGSTQDQVSGLEMGAHDYLAKPFDPPELLARVRVLLGLTFANFQGTEKIHFAGWEYDTLTRNLKSSEKKIALAPIEGDCLEFFLKNKNQVFTREELLERVWKKDAETDTRAVDNVVSDLRKHLGRDAIETIRGKGYCFRG